MSYMGNKKVTKCDLVESIYQKTTYEKAGIQKVIDNFLEDVKNALESGSSIELRGFGTFEPRLRKGRSVARNPKTGEKLSVAPHYVAAFRAGKELKQSLWNLEIKDKEN